MSFLKQLIFRDRTGPTIISGTFLSTIALSVLLPVFVCLVTIAPVRADSAGQTAAQVLRLGAGARIPAMGGAGVASVNEPSALHYNPAGLARMGSPSSVGVTHQNLVENINMGNVSLAKKIGSGNNKVVAGGLRYVDYGGQDRVEYQGGSAADDLTTVGSFSNNDLVLTGAYGRHLTRGFYVGVTGKIIRQELAGVKATAYAGDLGLQWNSVKSPLSFGLAVANVGTDLKFDRVNEPLPALVRSGITYNFNDLNVQLALDGEHTFVSQETGLRGGVEWTPWNVVAIRAGYDGNVDVDNGITGGFGFRFGNARVDYAILPFGVFGSVHRFSLVWKF